MQAVILAGGFGTRISEESHTRPKPMIEIGGRPILWHIMKQYSAHGINDFVILCGYKGYQIKEYFANYFLHMSDVTFDLAANSMEVHRRKAEPWRVTVLDTGENAMTGGRIRQAREYIEGPFCLTYGDGVSDVNISEVIAFHKSHEKAVTITAIQPSGRFGALDMDGDAVKRFSEKPRGDGQWVNGGFFVCDPKVLDYIEGEQTSFEQEPLANLASEDEVMAFRHRGFWASMDTMRDKALLESLWESGTPPWKIW